MHGSCVHPFGATSILLMALPFASNALAQTRAVQAADPPSVARWAAAAGGREKIAAVHSTYREATIAVAGYTGTIKTWHTADGKYRKEEKIGDLSTVEVFDGANGSVRRGDEPARKMTPPEIRRATSTAYANWNAVFFAFFPERRRGTLAAEADGTIVLRPEGGIEWRVTLGKEGLPGVMVHQEGERTVTVTFDSYEAIDGILFETAIRRSNGDPRFDALIRFTKTVLNPPIDPALFTVESSPSGVRG